MLESALERYSTAVGAVKDHIEANQQVFDAHQRLVERVIDARAALEDEAAEAAAKGEIVGSDMQVENGKHRVKVSKQTQTFADIETLDRFVAQGLVSQDLRNQIVKTVERPPKIIVGEV